MAKVDPKKQESLERLRNQLYQAEASGDTALAKKIRLIIKRLEIK